MINDKILSQEDTERYFARRARKYDYSAHWVDDSALVRKIWDLASADPKAYVLDIGIGTGKVAGAFHGQVKYVVGLDICKEMVIQAKENADRIVLAPAEKLPFKNEAFDVCVCRQGLQFMDLEAVISEMHRVLKPKGRVVLCHLAAYGVDDKDETFFIQKLRNPSRKNFFLPDDFLRLLKNKGFKGIESAEYFTRESVNQWIGTSCISENAKAKIREAYKNASSDFKKIHNIQFKNGDIFDTMKMVLVKAIKKQGK
ncbi:MAG: class I SAM-dependent methyltransferase [Candidatus Omnitrophota bacterium]